MGITLRKSKDRGHAQHGWLESYHTFSFADYYDPDHMGFRSLRVINEDRVAPGKGFGSHPHKDMEILSYVVQGSLKHQDSMGHESTILPGEVQKISAGTGIVHSEFNASSIDSVHFLQIWIVPDKLGLSPSYQQFSLPKPDAETPLVLIGSPVGGKDVVRFHQDVFIFRGHLESQHSYTYEIADGRGVWVQIIHGEVALNGNMLTAGDGVSIEHLKSISITSYADSEFLLFDLK